MSDEMDKTASSTTDETTKTTETITPEENEKDPEKEDHAAQVQEEKPADSEPDTTTTDPSTTTTNATTDEQPSELEKKIIRQVEYYFGNANLVRDKFLKEAVKKDNGWVPLSTLLTFNRLKSLSEDGSVILKALAKSDDDLLELRTGENPAIRRHPTKPLPADTDEERKQIQQRLLYVKGFPVDQTLDDLIDYFDRFGAESVQLRRDIKKNFKGSVFVLFQTPDKAKLFLEMEEFKYKDSPLVSRMYRHEYFAKKNGEKMLKQQEEVKAKEQAKLKKEQEEKELLQSKITKASVLKVTGVRENTKVDVIKTFFGRFGKVAWVDFESKADHAFVRFAAENEAVEAWDKAVAEAEEGKVKLDDSELAASVLEGAEEETHWKKMFQSINDRFGNKNKKFGGGGGRGSFKRRGGGGGPGGKKQKTDGGD